MAATAQDNLSIIEVSVTYVHGELGVLATQSVRTERRRWYVPAVATASSSAHVQAGMVACYVALASLTARTISNRLWADLREFMVILERIHSTFVAHDCQVWLCS